VEFSSNAEHGGRGGAHQRDAENPRWVWTDIRRAQSLLQTYSRRCGTYTSIAQLQPQICIYPDAVPPIHAVSHHVATDKVPAQNGDKFRSIFSDNLQPIATRGKKACGTLLVDKHCGNGCSIKRAPLSVSYYNEISGGRIGRVFVRTRCSAGPVCPCDYNLQRTCTVTSSIITNQPDWFSLLLLFLTPISCQWFCLLNLRKYVSDTRGVRG